MSVLLHGYYFDARTADMLIEVEKTVAFRIVQGSYSGGVSASAGTHDGGGACDLVSDFYDDLVVAMRRVGFAAWHRTPDQGFDPHCHGIAVQPGGKGDRGVLSSGAHDQVVDYYEGRNGLASGARDDGPRDWVGTTWEQYLNQQPKRKKGNPDMILISRKSDGRVHLCNIPGPAYIATGEALEEIRKAIGDPSHVAAVDDATFTYLAASSAPGALPK